MKHLTYLIILVMVLISCNQTDKKKVETQVAKGKSEEKTTTNKIDFEKLENVIPSLTIIEYDQWKELFETVITNDGLYRYEKNWQSGELKREILHIEFQGLYEQINQILEKDFLRSQDYYEDWNDNTYFIHLKINRTELQNVNISFKNCKSKELEQLIAVINKMLPEGEQIELKGKIVVDNFVPSDSITTWSSLKSIAKYNSISTFKLRDVDRNIIALLDSTKFGKSINNAYSLKSSYLIAVRENIGKYYPCIVLVEQYECDDIVKFLAVFMIDSTFKETGDFELISGYGSDSEGEWDCYGTIKDTLLQIDRKSSFECYEDMEGIERLQIQEQFKLNPNGQIEEIKTDTIDVKYCR